jgi:hypothetical protein
MAARVKMLKNGRFVDPESEPCRASGCTSFLPGGRYEHKLVFVACSPGCYKRCLLEGRIRLTCGCECAREVSRAFNRNNKTGLVFFSQKHRGDYVKSKRLTETCGAFLPISADSPPLDTATSALRVGLSPASSNSLMNRGSNRLTM